MTFIVFVIIITSQYHSNHEEDITYSLLFCPISNMYFCSAGDIAANGHLPQVPSAAAVDEDGVDVGEINNVLLQKVEELTLYIIDLQKQIDELKAN